MNELERYVKKYTFWLKASEEGFETDILEIMLWAVYREELGKLAHLLSEEEREQVARADEIAKKLAEEKKDEEAGIGFKCIVDIIKKYPVYPAPQTQKVSSSKKVAQLR